MTYWLKIIAGLAAVLIVFVLVTVSNDNGGEAKKQVPRRNHAILSLN